MKRYLKALLFLLTLSSLFIVPTVFAEEEEEEIRFSLGAGSIAQDWDPVAQGGANILDVYSSIAQEGMVYFDKDFSGKNDEYIPMLATSWVIEFWPEGINTKGFLNSEGIKSIEFTLRSGVKFHDGSDWNATVAKWNIDRVMIMNGNLTGTGLKKWKHSWYVDAMEYEDFFTDDWDLSRFNNTMATYGTWTGCQDPTMMSQVPRINNTEITETKASGGKIKVTSNAWNSGLLGSIGLIRMMSMDAYQDYFTESIIGYGNDLTYPQPDVTGGNYPATGFPGHMIGTGTYRFIVHDETGSPAGGTMEKFDDYWGKAAIEARGGFIVDHFDLVYFPYDATGEAARNTAITTGELDFAFHTSTSELNFDDVNASAFVNWYDTTYDGSVNIISFNCIDDFYVEGDTFPYVPAQPGPDEVKGVPVAFRKALSYAFDYDTYISAAKQDRAVRLNGPIGRSALYYNEEVVAPDFDIEVARQALIDGGIAPSEASSWTNSQWEARASSDPLYVWDYAWDDAHEDVNNEVENAVERIGCATNDSLEWKFEPYCFSNIYESMFYGGTSWPFYTNGGFNMKWPMPDTATPGYLTAMLHSDEVWNLGFSYNDTADDWLDQMEFAGPERMQELHDLYITWFNTVSFPWLCISQDKNGFAINAKYELDYVYDGTYQLPARIRLKGWTTPAIPGYSIEVFALISLVAVSFTIYSTKRKIRN
ncbi:MAG: ABC transporter substrate-binding protein [Promethearchaeota archaeon]